LKLRGAGRLAREGDNSPSKGILTVSFGRGVVSELRRGAKPGSERRGLAAAALQRKKEEIIMKRAWMCALGAACLIAAATLPPAGAEEEVEKGEKTAPKKEQAAKPEKKPAALGETAPAFELEDHKGKKVKLSDFKGETVVLEFINPGCPYVKRHYELGTMKSLAERYKDKKVAWLAINSTHTMGREDNKKWAEENKLPYPILDDAKGKVGRSYGAKTTPHMFVIDKKGKLAYSGAIDNQATAGGPAKEETVNYVAKALDELLAGKPVSTPETKPYGCSVKYAN